MIVVNGNPRDDLAGGLTIRGLLDALDVDDQARGVAVAVDAEVVPRSAWGTTELVDGAAVEVLVAVQGG